jgi:hypothetical protein
MTNLDDQLRAALRRREPSVGFADHVLARTKVTPGAPRRAWTGFWAMGAIASTLALVTVSFTTYQHARQERAARQAELALRIAAEKLNLARDRMFKNAGQKDY